MTPYDAGMIGVIVLGMIWGLFKGFIWQVASLASLVVGYAAAHGLSAQLAPHFPGDALQSRTLAMIATYVGVSAGIFLIAWMIRATLRKMKFEAFDRHLGMLLGGIEGALLGVIVTIFVVSLAPSTRGPIFASQAGRAVSTVMANVGPVLPPEVRTELGPYLATLDPDAPAPVPATAPTAAGESPTEPSILNAFTPKSTNTADPSTKPASLTDLLNEGEQKIRNKIQDAANRQVQQAIGGDNDGRSTNRR